MSPVTLESRHRWRDALLVQALRCGGIVAGSVVLLIAGFLVFESWPALTQLGVGRFAGDESWHPIEQRYRLTPMIAASLAAMGGAMLLAGPLGVVSALFCHSYAPKPVARVYRRVIELLAGIPSVVYGFWGLVTLVPLLAKLQPPGPSLLAGVLILTLMVLPTVALLSEAALSAVPDSMSRGAHALGLGRWAALRQVMLPAAWPGITTALLLAAGRAVGETMAVLMVCGNVVQWPGQPFEPVRTLTANIALEMGYAFGIHRSTLFVTGLILLVVVTGLVVLSRLASHGKLSALRRAAAHG